MHSEIQTHTYVWLVGEVEPHSNEEGLGEFLLLRIDRHIDSHLDGLNRSCRDLYLPQDTKLKTIITTETDSYQ